MQFRKDAFSISKAAFRHADVVISTGILHELQRTAKRRGKKGAYARTSLELVKKNRIRILKNNSYPDIWIHNIAARYKNTIVITNDTALFSKIRKTGGKALKLSKSGILKW